MDTCGALNWEVKMHQGNARDKKQRGEKEKHEVSPRMRIMPPWCRRTARGLPIEDLRTYGEVLNPVLHPLMTADIKINIIIARG